MVRKNTLQTGKTPTIAIGYPPIASKKGTALLSQNRQFQFFNAPTYIYPMVPAYAASHLKSKGYKVFWMDGIAEKKSYIQWFTRLKQKKPDMLMIETKAPVIKTHWSQINDIKKKIPSIKIVLVGDHVTYLPYESFEHSMVDYVIAGGDYDFVIVNLLNHIYKGKPLEGGVYWRKRNTEIAAIAKGSFMTASKEMIYNSGPASLNHTVDDLPFIDRNLTKWKLYAYHNGNYKYFPGTYMYSGRDCWWNKCTFCVWDHTLNPVGSYRSFSAERLFAEVKYVVDTCSVREIFDDAGTFFVGPKLRRFCELMIESGYNKKVKYGCNMRLNALTGETYRLMKKAGFRFILYGMESANQKTLNKLEKGLKTKQIIEGASLATEAGLEPHITIMLGYPWESLQDAKNTINLAKYCLKKGYFNTMQATIVIPYPGTPLHRECKEKGLLLTKDYERYDMREPVMKIPFGKKKLLALTQDLYSAFFSPEYILRKLISIRNIDDVKFFFLAGKRLIGHLLDFDPKQAKGRAFSFSFWKQVVSKFAASFF